MSFRSVSSCKSEVKLGPPTTLEEFLSDFPGGISDVNVERTADTYHKTHKADARELFREIADFLETCASLAGADGREHQQSPGMASLKFMLERRLERLNKRDDDLWALEALPADGPVN